MNLSNKNVIHLKKDGIEYLQFRRLLQYQDKINHAYSLGIDKDYRTAKVNKENLEPQKYESAIKSYKALCENIGSNYQNIIKTNQEHTAEVKIVSEKIKIQEPDI